jgi:hypothetical protein
MEGSRAERSRASTVAPVEEHDSPQPEIKTAADIARIRDQGRILSTQEIKELNTRLKALRDMQKIEEQFQELERQQQQSTPRTSRERTTPDANDNLDGEEPRSYKRFREAKRVKVTPNYTLRVTSSLREWEDWRRDVERVFKADPHTYKRDELKIIKALDYVDQGMKSL